MKPPRHFQLLTLTLTNSMVNQVPLVFNKQSSNAPYCKSYFTYFTGHSFEQSTIQPVYHFFRSHQVVVPGTQMDNGHVVLYSSSMADT
jgi:hypothetical protein